MDGDVGLGRYPALKAGKMSLASCVGQTQVLVRFGFVSDYSGTDQGVWLDDIKIRKLS